jgi:hypothetical protein
MNGNSKLRTQAHLYTSVTVRILQSKAKAVFLRSLLLAASQENHLANEAFNSTNFLSDNFGTYLWILRWHTFLSLDMLYDMAGANFMAECVPDVEVSRIHFGSKVFLQIC